MLLTFVFINGKYAKGLEIVIAWEGLRMNKDQINLLKWFVKFASLDIDGLEIGGLAKLKAEICFLLTRGLWKQDGYLTSTEEEEKLISNYDQITTQKVKELQNGFVNEFDAAMKKIDQFREAKGLDQWSQPKILSDFSNITEKNPTVTLTPELGIMCLAETKETKNGLLIRGESGWRDKGFFHIASERDISVSMLLLLFIRALDGVSISVFRRCDECGHWFLHTSKRERRYCSNLCAARKGNRDRREAKKRNSRDEYEKELEDGRKRARNSYVKRVKSITHNVKIGRRPRKNKKKTR